MEQLVDGDWKHGHSWPVEVPIRKKHHSAMALATVKRTVPVTIMAAHNFAAAPCIEYG